jgi:methionyl-tRNA formyltransferase
VERFDLDPESATAFSLDLESQQRLLRVFKEVIGRALAGDELPRAHQGEGRYVSREELEDLRRVRAGDDVSRKLRAFWYPPWPGATFAVDDRELTLVDEDLLGEVAQAYLQAGHIP